MGEQVGRFLGVAHDRGQAMCFWVLPKQNESPHANFQVLAKSTTRPLLDKEYDSPDIKAKLELLDQSIRAKCGGPVTDKGSN